MTNTHTAAEVAKAAPPLTVTGMELLGFPLSDWVLVLTAVYTLCQIAVVLRRMLRRQGASPCSTDDCPARKPYPRLRALRVAYGAGRGVARLLPSIKAFCHEQGITRIESWCRESVARLYGKHGFDIGYCVPILEI